VAGQIVGAASGAVVGMVKPDTRQAQEVLDEIARREGWEGDVR